MKIYFCGSIAGGRTYLDMYTKIVRFLQSQGHVLTEHIIDPNVLHLEQKLTAKQIYERDMEWLSTADVAIAEISNPSLGVGYEIGYALNIGKPVLALYEDGLFISRMITGNTHPNLSVLTYGSNIEWKTIIDQFLKKNE